MCGCFVAIIALVSPRLAIFLVWLFDRSRMSAAFDSFWIALLGVLAVGLREGAPATRAAGEATA